MRQGQVCETLTEVRAIRNSVIRLPVLTPEDECSFAITILALQAGLYMTPGLPKTKAPQYALAGILQHCLRVLRDTVIA